MNRKNIITLILLLIISVSACTEIAVEEKGTVGEGEDQNLQEDIIVLTMYVEGYHKLMLEAISYFNEKNKNVEIERVLFSDSEMKENRLKVELMAGEGPDIIHFSAKTFNNLHKVMEGGSFHDLKPYMDDDDQYDLTLFNKEVFDCGVFDEKRYFVPYHYDVGFLWSTEETLEQYGINKEELLNYTLEQYVELIEGLPKKEDFYFFNGWRSIKPFIYNSGIELVDYKNRQANFQSQDFVKLLEYYKKLNNSIATYQMVRAHKDKYYGMIRDGHSVATMSNTLYPRTLSGFNSEIKERIRNQQMVLLPFPKYNSTGHNKARILGLLGVNQNSKNPSEAVDFIKMMLGSEGQGIRDYMGSPINQKFQEEQFEIYFDDSLPYSEEIVTMAKTIRSNIGGTLLMDKNIEDTIDETVQEFIDDKLTAEQAAEKIQQKVMLHLNE